MVSIRVKPTRRGINQTTRRLDPTELYLLVKGSLVDTLDTLKEIVAAKTPQDTGQAVGNLVVEINGSSLKDLHGAVVSPDAYFSVLEYGRTPGARMPPNDPIAMWAVRHGIAAKDVFLVRRAIAERGLPALHIMQDALAQGPQHFKTVFLKRWLESWGPGF